MYYAGHWTGMSLFRTRLRLEGYSRLLK
jgi:hypothetical protein